VDEGKSIVEMQREVCRRIGADYLACEPDSILGLADTLRQELLPLNGLRYLPVNGTNGWFIWAGEELSQADDFFKPVHAHHLTIIKPQLIKYCGLAPGWRFLIAGDYEDIWYEAALLKE
jgi:hypothetical protein